MKKALAIFLTLVMLLCALPFTAMADSVAITPRIAIDCFEDFLKTNPKPDSPREFNKYKGHFYADLDHDGIPELITAYDGNTDSCVNVYYCRLDFDMSNGLFESTPVYTAMPVYWVYYGGSVDRDLRTFIGGSGGTTVDLVRLTDGRYAFEFEEFGHGNTALSYYIINSADSEYQEIYNAKVAEEVWYLRGKLPGTYDLYTMANPDTPFSDISETDYYYEAVKWAIANGVTNGTSATTFSPEATCTREQVVTFLYRANGSPAVSGTNPFTDVKSTDYSYNAILWAVANGITNGTSATTFSPKATCTSAHVLTFLYRAKGCPAVSGTVGNQYYDAAALWAKEIGLYDNLPFGFEAGRDAPRAEIVSYLYGTKDIVPAETPVTPGDPATLADGRYEVYFLREGLSKDGTNESVLVNIIQYVGLSADEAHNLYRGQVISLADKYPGAEDIIVNTWSYADTAVMINGVHEFWYNHELDNGNGRYVYINYDLSPSGAGLTYVTREKVRLTVDPNAKIEDWSSSMLETRSSIADHFDNRFSDSSIGHIVVTDGKITLANFAFRP